MEHTKGPWKYGIFSENADVRSGYVYTERPETESTRANPDICKVYAMGDDGRPWGEMEANARLIEAAPELLEACKHMLRLMNGLGYHFDAMEDAEAAIAKAEGRE